MPSRRGVVIARAVLMRWEGVCDWSGLRLSRLAGGEIIGHGPKPTRAHFGQHLITDHEHSTAQHNCRASSMRPAYRRLHIERPAAAPAARASDLLPASCHCCTASPSGVDNSRPLTARHLFLEPFPPSSESASAGYPSLSFHKLTATGSSSSTFVASVGTGPASWTQALEHPPPAPPHRAESSQAAPSCCAPAWVHLHHLPHRQPASQS